MTDSSIDVSVDEPLRLGSAIDSDQLHRRPFAQSVVDALARLNRQTGLTVSIEGKWGSGKTSVLAMIEELMSAHPTTSTSPVIVHFNPWLVGDRNALLRQFFEQIASAIQLKDRAKEGKRVAKEVKAYAKVFGVLRLIPAVEPWAGIVKSVLDAVGKATQSLAEHKELDLEGQKKRLEDALRAYSRSIVVFVDDIDRLFPTEVFEMLRIIKAVGHLPRVGYVVAWDPKYVSSALERLGVPDASTYLEKIVQVRLTLPEPPPTSLARLMSGHLETLPEAALMHHFPGGQERLTECYHRGLRDLVRRPRDLRRVFSVARLLEVQMRGEVVFADILALAALMVKADAVFDKLRASPEHFVGSPSGEFDKAEDIVKRGNDVRAAAYEKAEYPKAARRLVHFLFPLVAEAEDGYSSPTHSEADGRIANPRRLLIALQHGLASADASANLARKFLSDADSRDDIALQLTEQNSLEFLELLGDMLEAEGTSSLTDPVPICLSLAELADTASCAARTRDLNAVFSPRIERAALRAIEAVGEKLDEPDNAAIALAVAQSPDGLSVSAQLVLQSDSSRGRERFALPSDGKEAAIRQFGANVLKAAQTGRLLAVANPGLVLHAVARHAPSDAPAIFAELRRDDDALDSFAQAVLWYSVDSHKGLTFRLPDRIETLTAYCSLPDLRVIAEKRLSKSTVTYPARAAWRAVLENKALYAVDGTENL